MGEIKWFMGVYVLIDRAKKLIWLSQRAYLEKIAIQIGLGGTGLFPETPMQEELIPAEEEPSGESPMLPQRKVGSILLRLLPPGPISLLQPQDYPSSITDLAQNTTKREIGSFSTSSELRIWP